MLSALPRVIMDGEKTKNCRLQKWLYKSVWDCLDKVSAHHLAFMLGGLGKNYLLIPLEGRVFVHI